MPLEHEPEEGGDKSEVVQFLNQLKQSCGLSLSAIADKAGLSRGHVYQWFSGNVPLPFTDNLLKLATALNVGEEVLLRLVLLDIADRKVRDRNGNARRVGALAKKLLKPKARSDRRQQYFKVNVSCRNAPGIIGSLGQFLGQREFDVESISQSVLHGSGMAEIFTVVRNIGDRHWSLDGMEKAIAHALRDTSDLSVLVVDLYDLGGG